MNNIIENLNISYNKNNNEQQKLDLYYPNNKDDNRILVVYIHGGFWVARDKKEYSNLGQYLSSECNVACAVINYRLSNKDDKDEQRVLYPEHNYDLIESIVWLIQNSNNNYSPNKIVLMGHSCGGYMIGTVVLNWDLYIDQMANDSKNRYTQFNNNKELYKSYKSSIISCIGIQGLYDFKALYEDFPNYKEDIEIVFDNDWYDLIRITSTPISTTNLNWLIVHSPDDAWVNRRQSVNLFDHLTQVLKFKNVILEENVNGTHFDVVTQFGNKTNKESDKTRDIIKQYLNKL